MLWKNGLIGWVLGLAIAPCALANVLIVPANKDTTLFEDAAGGLGGGASSAFFTGRLGSLGNGALRRAAISFDLSAIPAGALVTSASLNLTLVKGNGGPQPIELHRFTTNWGEGASVGGPQGTTAATNDATWVYNFYKTSTWVTPGGDFIPSPSATQTADFSGSIIWGSTSQMVADVQGWANDPSSNFGWALVGNESTLQTAKEFSSRDSFAGQPALTVTFTVPEPGLGMLGSGALALLLARRRKA